MPLKTSYSRYSLFFVSFLEKLKTFKILAISSLFMPLDRRTRNHVKSMYIGAMVVGVDLVTGFTAMLKILESKKNIILIFKDLKANFLKRAEGDVHYICREAKAISAAVEETINTGERVNIAVPVIATVPDSFGEEPVATFTITLSMKEK